MKKRVISGLLAAAMLIGANSALAFAPVTYSSDVKVYLNGEDVYANSDAKPCIMNDRTMVQVKPIFEELGYNASYDEESKSATFNAKASNTGFVFIDGDYSMCGIDTSSGDLFEVAVMDVPAAIYNDTFYVPLRAFCEYINIIDVDWDDSARTVYLTITDQNYLDAVAAYDDKVAAYADKIEQ